MILLNFKLKYVLCLWAIYTTEIECRPIFLNRLNNDFNVTFPDTIKCYSTSIVLSSVLMHGWLSHASCSVYLICPSFWACRTYIVHQHNGKSQLGQTWVRSRSWLSFWLHEAGFFASALASASWLAASYPCLTWVNVKGHMGQGQIMVPNKGRWAHDKLKLLHFIFLFLFGWQSTMQMQDMLVVCLQIG